MEQLIQQMKVILASTYSMYLKSQNYHWNVEGINFPQYHDFFKDVYEELAGYVDSTAEQIRTLGVYAPGSFARFQELTTIEDELATPTDREMVRRLKNDNEKLLTELISCANIADELGVKGLVNYLEGRIDNHSKLGWMLDASSK